MAGIKVPQYPVFKIGTNKLKAFKWDLTISVEEAEELEEMIKLFEAQEFRLIFKILHKRDPKKYSKINDVSFKDYICSIIIDSKTDFKRATSDKGIKINDITFKRFVGTTGGLKNNTLLFVNADIIDELNKRCECGRDKEVKLIPAKYEAYKALTCSSSQEIISPKKILVVDDCLTKYYDDIIRLDNSEANIKQEMKKRGIKDEEKEKYEKLKDSPKSEPIDNIELENNNSDGFSLCTYDFMKKVSEKLGLDYVTDGVCLRNAWFKGMLYAFPIYEFIEKYNNGNYIIKDIWGNEQDLRECEMITTPSSFKLANAYTSIEQYMEEYKKNGYEFAVTKISPKVLDDERELNYQYLQSYLLEDSDIEDICKPTIDFIKNSLCGGYEETKTFVGINEQTEYGTWQKALDLNEKMLNDPFIIDSVHRLIKKKIDDAKIGKLKVHGNYQIASGDPFAFMQNVCGLEITGLLKANECYSNYWNNENKNSEKKTKEVVVFRSPMSIHNNIRKCKLADNEETKEWYRYMGTIMIINAWDSFCAAENGCDYDSDILFSTNNPVLLNKHRKLRPVHCMQSNTEKIIINEEDVKKTNKNGMGNKVGKITNRITAMEEIKSRFSPDSEEYKELEERISCGQLYQQDELDKIKGIIATPMPTYWYNYSACIGMKNEKFLKSICIDKKPYFMTYVYDDYKRKYKSYIDNCNKKSIRLTGYSIQQLKDKERNGEILSDEEANTLKWFEKKMPFGRSECAMNSICYYIENQLDGCKTSLKKSNDFDYTFLKKKRKVYDKNKNELENLCNKYIKSIKLYKEKNTRRENDNVFLEDKEEEIQNRQNLKDNYREKAKKICPNDDERLNIVLDLCYGGKGNKQFCWDVVGDLICKRLEEYNEDK